MNETHGMSLRRIRLTGVVVALVFGAVLVIRSDTANSQSRGDDHGPVAGRPHQTVSLLSDPSGIDWKVDMYLDDLSRTCLDFVAARTTGETLGSTGGCGAPSPVAEAVLSSHMKAVSPILSDISAAIAPFFGQLRFDGNLHSIVAGVITCECSVKVTWSDGVETTAEGTGGVFLTTRLGSQGLMLASQANKTAGAHIEAVSHATGQVVANV